MGGVELCASFEVIKLLLEAHPEAASEKDPTYGYTPLHYSEKLDADTVRFLIEKCPGAAMEKDVHGELPLHWVAEHGASLEVVNLLLDANKEAPFVPDDSGRVPFKLALDSDIQKEVLEVLRKANPAAGRSALPKVPRESLLPVALLFPGMGSQ